MTGRRETYTVARPRLGLFACALPLLLVACGGSDSTATAESRPAIEAGLAPVFDVGAGTWAVIGSSTAAGAGATPGNGWVDVLNRSLTNRGAMFHNLAKGGTVTYHGLSVALPPVADRPLPDPNANVDMALSLGPVVVVIAYPSNDTALGYDKSETVYNVLSMRQVVLKQNKPVLVLSSQPRNLSNEKLQTMREIDQQLLEKIGPCFVDVRTSLAGNDGHLAAEYDSGDGVHPNDAGHRLIAERVQAVVESGACIRTGANG